MTEKHWLDRPILRDLFWFIVLPYKLRQWMNTRPAERLGDKRWPFDSDTSGVSEDTEALLASIFYGLVRWGGDQKCMGLDRSGDKQ